MLQKIKKSYLKDLLFFTILIAGLWALYRSRAFLLSKTLSKVLKQPVHASKVHVQWPFAFQIYNINGKGFTLDTLEFKISPLSFVKFRLNSLTIKNFTVNVDSIPHKGTTGKTKRNFSIPNLPVFLSNIYLGNIRIIRGKDTIYLSDASVSMKGTTKNFLATILVDELNVNSFELSFFKGTLYKIGPSFNLSKGSLCSNILCIENMKAEYDSLLTAKLEGVSLTTQNIYAQSISLSLDDALSHAHINIKHLELQDRTISNINLSMKRYDKLFRGTLSASSDWFSGEGNLKFSIKNKNVTYDLSMYKLSYAEKNAKLKGKIFLKGNNKNAHGILRLTELYINGEKEGKLTSFFHETGLKTFIVDSGYIANTKSYMYFQGVLTPDSQFIYLEPYVNLEDYDTLFRGYVTGYVAATFIDEKDFYVNTRLQLDNFSSKYLTINRAEIHTFSPSHDSLNFAISASGVQTEKGITFDTLNIQGILNRLEHMSFIAFGRRDTDWINTQGEAFRGNNEYTVDIDTVFGNIAGMSILTERTIVLSKRMDILSLSTGDINVGNGDIKFQGTLSRNGEINAYLTTKNLQLPTIRGAHINLSTTTQVSGNLKSPILISEGIFKQPSYNDISFDELDYSISFLNQVLRVDHLSLIQQGGNMDLQGSLVFKSSLTLNPDSIDTDVLVKFNNFDISFLLSYIGEIFNLEYATVNGNLGIKGSIKDPFFTGTVNLSGTNGYLEAVGLRTDNLTAYVQFNGKEMILKSLHAQSDAGEITAFGTIKTRKLLFDSPDVTILARDVYLEIGADIQAMCDGTLYLTHGTNTHLLLKGNVKVKEGYLFAEFSSPKSVTREETNPVLSIDLKISWKDNVFLINEIAEIEFSGNLSYTYDNSGMLINGKLNALGGNFSYFEHLFKVTEGDVIFNNLSQINPSLNISAVTDVDSYSINLNIGGTLTEPVINLTSEPPLDESNILALLTFGKLLSESGTDILTANFIERKALGFAQSYLLRSIRRKLGLRELEVSTGSIKEDPHLTVGFYVTRDIYLKYYHDFLSIQYDRFDLRYRISRYFGLSAVRDEEGQYYFGMFFEKRF